MALPWNGSFIENIESYISYNVIDNDIIFLYLRNGELGYLSKFNSSNQLIFDEIKYLFKLPKIGRHKIIYNGKHFILNRILGEEELFSDSEFEKLVNSNPQHIKSYINNIQSCLLFRWIVGFKQNVHSNLIIRTYYNGMVYILSNKEGNTQLHDDCSLSETIINKWFLNRSNMINSLEKMFMGVIMAEFKQKIKEIILRIDPEQIHLAHQINCDIIKYITPTEPLLICKEVHYPVNSENFIKELFKVQKEIVIEKSFKDYIQNTSNHEKNEKICKKHEKCLDHLSANLLKKYKNRRNRHK